MATPKTKPPRAWRLDDLLDLGRREGEKANYSKAVPVLILEKWVQGEREAEVANYVWTKELAMRLENCGLISFKPKGSGNLFGAPSRIQNSRNLTRPHLIEKAGGGMFRVNLPHYEPLLQEYRQKYRDLYPEDYRKLFPKGEPEWEPLAESHDAKPQVRQEPDSRADSFSNRIRQVAQDFEEHWQDDLKSLEARLRLLEQENQRLREQLDKARPISDEITDGALRKRVSNLGSSPFDTILREAGVILEDRLRAASGISSKLHGVDLVDAALAPDRGVLIYSPHPGEQDGVRMLYRGAMQFIRNPPMHQLIEYREDTARLFIRLIDSLLQLLSEAKRQQNHSA